MSGAALQQLLDRAAISDVVHAYATGLDRRDWALYRAIFTDALSLDFGSLGIRSGAWSADAWVRSAQALFAGFSATQHTSTNHVHDVRGDAATCTSAMQAEHFVAPGPDVAPGAERWTIGGYYVNQLVRTPAGWKLCGVALHVTWQSGNLDLPRIARARGRALRGAAR